MTPKEKAEQLANRFFFKSIFEITNEELKEERKNAKECAIICVDEISKNEALNSINSPHRNNVDYWLMVREEIQNLQVKKNYKS